MDSSEGMRKLPLDVTDSAAPTTAESVTSRGSLRIPSELSLTTAMAGWPMDLDPKKPSSSPPGRLIIPSLRLLAGNEQLALFTGDCARAGSAGSVPSRQSAPHSCGARRRMVERVIACLPGRLQAEADGHLDLVLAARGVAAVGG